MNVYKCEIENKTCSSSLKTDLYLQAKYLAQIVITGVQIVGRAFTKAIKQEIQASQQAARARTSASQTSQTKQAATNALTGMSLSV